MSNKDNTVLFAALAVGAAWFLTKPKAAIAAPAGGSGGAVPGGAQEIFYGTANGWRYFTDGTAISPDGTYYKNGQMIWNPMM
jgi:hypothetical protein